VRAHGKKAHGEIESLPLETMTDVRTSETEHFELPEDFVASDFVHGDLGFGRVSRERFIVEFDARVADEVKARRHHPHQRIAIAPDGRVRVSLPFVDARAAIAFVLSWGDAAKIVDPPELASEMATILSRAASKYS
jgi:predicted DNA-binding transcriptional regulator YafY